jgi:hypothetical protein
VKRTFCGFSKIVFSNWNTDWKASWTEKERGMEDFFCMNRSENVEVRCKGGELGGGGDEGVGSCAGSVGLAMLNELLFVVKRKEGTRVV